MLLFLKKIPVALGGGNCTTGYSPTQDCYIIGNSGWSNSLSTNETANARKTVQLRVHKKGISSNGPAIGIVLAHNSDTQGIDSGTTLTHLQGGMVIVDPLFRMNLAGTRVKSSPPLASGVLNATVMNDGSLYFGSVLQSVPKIQKTCAGIQSVIDSYFRPLRPAPATLSTWMWYSSAMQVYSYLELIGPDPIICDDSLRLTPQLFLVLTNINVKPSATFNQNSLGVIIANSAHFSGVVSRSNATNGVDCGLLAGRANGAPSGIFVTNSSYFIIDGIAVNKCGGGVINFRTYSIENGNRTVNSNNLLGGVTIIGLNSLSTPISAGIPTPGLNTSSTLFGNSTQIANSRVQNSQGLVALLYRYRITTLSLPHHYLITTLSLLAV